MDWNTIRISCRLFKASLIWRSIIGNGWIDIQQVYVLRLRNFAHVSHTLAQSIKLHEFNICPSLRVYCSACSQKLLEWQDSGEQQRCDKIILAKSIVRESKKKRSESRKEKTTNAKKEDQKTVTSSESNNNKDINNQPAHKTHRRR